MAREDADFTAPGTYAYVGRAVRLRAVSTADYDLFLGWRTDLSRLHTWSINRAIPTVDAFTAELTQSFRQSVTLLVEDSTNGEAVGFVQLHSINLKDRWCMLRMYFDEEGSDAGLGPEACAAFLDYAFSNFPMRKIYADLFEDNLVWLGAAIMSCMVEEGRFKEHSWFSGSYRDLLRYALYDDTWKSERERVAHILDVGHEASRWIGGVQQPEGR